MTETVRLNGIPLQQLRFENCSNESMNFDFVLRLRDLELFKTDQPLPGKLISKLLRLPLLTYLEYSADGTAKRIERMPTGRFHLNGEPLSLQELLSQFDAKPDSTVESEL